MPAPKLVTLLPSTDVDLGRWLLQLWDMPYRERPHAPVFHVFALWANGVGADDYPLYVSRGGKFGTIESFLSDLAPGVPAERRLVPDKTTENLLYQEVMAFQHAARWTMGTGTVHWAYYHFLRHRDAVWPSLTTGVPWWETALLIVGYPVVKALMFRSLGLSAPDAGAALETVRRGFDEVDRMLKDGRRYLFADRLTVADLAFAANAAPMILAEGYGGHLPAYDACPPEMRTVFDELRARPAGRFVQRLYDEHRTRTVRADAMAGESVTEPSRAA